MTDPDPYHPKGMHPKGQRLSFEADGLLYIYPIVRALET